MKNYTDGNIAHIQPITTMQLLAMQYNFQSIIPLERVADDYLGKISKTELHRQAKAQKFGFATLNTRTEKNPKYYVPIESLAAWLDKLKKEAILDHKATHNQKPL